MDNIKVNVHGAPLLSDKEARDLFDPEGSFDDYFFLRPKYKWLPDENSNNEELKKVPEGMYLVGLEVISEKWVNKGFCGMLLCKYGLVLDEANPIIKKEDYRGKEEMVYLSFDHIAFSLPFGDAKATVEVDSKKEGD